MTADHWRWLLEMIIADDWRRLMWGSYSRVLFWILQKSLIEHRRRCSVRGTRNRTKFWRCWKMLEFVDVVFSDGCSKKNFCLGSSSMWHEVTAITKSLGTGKWWEWNCFLVTKFNKWWFWVDFTCFTCFERTAGRDEEKEAAEEYSRGCTRKAEPTADSGNALSTARGKRYSVRWLSIDFDWVI